MRKTLLLGALLLFTSAVPALAEEAPEPLSVDYVIGLLNAGMTGDAIVEHILDNELVLVVRKGDIDRLLDAGAGEDVLMAVLQHTWSRPQRLDMEGAGEEEGEPVEDDGADSRVYLYGGLYFGWPGYYYSPYYYGGYAYYYPYYYPTYYVHGGHRHGRLGHDGYAGRYYGHGGKTGVGVAGGFYSGSRGVVGRVDRGGRSRGATNRGRGGGFGRGITNRGRGGGFGRGMTNRGRGGGFGRGMTNRGRGGPRGGRARGGGRGNS